MEAVFLVMATHKTVFVDVKKLLGLNRQYFPLALLADADLKYPKSNPKGRRGEH